MLMSSRIRSGGSRSAARIANLPPGAGRTLYPRSLSMPASTWRLAAVSSTIRMLAARATPSALAGFNGVSRAKQVEQLPVLEVLGQAAQSFRDAEVAGFDVPDLRQQP